MPIPGGPLLTGAQTGADEVVADSTTGQVRWIDGTTYQVSPPVPIGHPADQLAVYPTEGTTFVIDRTSDVAIATDPRTLAVRASYSLDAKVTDEGIVSDGGGGLWAIDSATGDLEHVDPSGITLRRRAVGRANARLVTAAGRPVAVDLAARRAFELRTDGTPGASGCVDVTVGDATVSVAGSSRSERIYTTSPEITVRPVATRVLTRDDAQ